MTSFRKKDKDNIKQLYAFEGRPWISIRILHEKTAIEVGKYFLTLFFFFASNDKAIDILWLKSSKSNTHFVQFDSNILQTLNFELNISKTVGIQ